MKARNGRTAQTTFRMPVVLPHMSLVRGVSGLREQHRLH